MESIKQLFQVFTNKELFIEWLLAVNISIGKKLLKIKATSEIDDYLENNNEIDMRTAPESVIKGLIYDDEVIKARWDLCSSCEFLMDDERCKQCGCFMRVKHKMAVASCPIGKWDQYKESDNGNYIN